MNIPSKPYRCAIYFTPTIDSDWWSFGNQWLGRCPDTNTLLTPLHIPDVEPSLFLQHTTDPRRYGWHATLKAPFALRTDCSVSDLLEGMHALAGRLPACTLPPMRVTDTDGFIALRPTGDLTAINRIASACVTELHAFAAPLSQTEFTRRRQSNLTPHQDELLVTWGYPWVLDQFQFHFSLTGPTARMDPRTQDLLLQAAINHFGSLAPCPFNHLSLFIEQTPGAEFLLVDQVELRG